MRALTVGELLDASFSAVRRNFWTLALATLVVIVPVSILSTLVSASTSDRAFDLSTTTVVADGEYGRYIAGSLVTLALTGLGAMLATAACLRAVGGDIVGQRYSAGESLRFAAARFWPLVLVSILYFLALIGGVLLLIVGIVWVWVLFSLAVPALLFEDLRGTKALGRSRALIKDHWWRTFGAMLVMQLITAILAAVLAALIGGVILVDSENEALNAVVLTVANVVSYAISLPLTAALATYIYFDLRVRKEGYDIQLLAERIGAPAPAPAPAAPPSVEGLPPRDAPPAGGFLPPRAPGG